MAIRGKSRIYCLMASVFLLVLADAAQAQCRPTGEADELSGTFVRSAAADYLVLDAPLDCEASERGTPVERLMLAFTGARPAADEIADNTEVLVSGAFGALATAGEALFNVTDIISLADDDGDSGETPLTVDEKATMIDGFQRFQQAVASRDAAAFKLFISFPLDGLAASFTHHMLPDSAKALGDAPLTEALFVRYQNTIFDELAPLTHIGVNPGTMSFSEYRENALTAEQQARHYTETEEDSGVWWWMENGKRHEISGVCDKVSTATLNDTSLMVTMGTDANLTLPGSSELCDGADIFFFKLVEGEMKLVSATSAG